MFEYNPRSLKIVDYTFKESKALSVISYYWNEQQHLGTDIKFENFHKVLEKTHLGVI